MGFWALVKGDSKCYKRPLLSQGFWATSFHRYGSIAREVRFKPLRTTIRATHHILIKVSEVLFGISIGPNVVVGRRLRIEHFGTIIIHSEVRMGSGVLIRQGVTIGNKSAQDPDGVPTIGDNVDIGAGAKILGRIHVGNNAVIGANAVVVHDVPEGATFVGAPARPITRSPPARHATERPSQ